MRQHPTLLTLLIIGLLTVGGTILPGRAAAALTTDSASGVFNSLPQSTIKNEQSALDKLFNNSAYQFILTILTAAGVMSLAYGSFQYITAGGNTEKTDAGRNIIIYSILGIIVIMGLFFLLNASRNLGNGLTNESVTTQL